MGLYLIPQSPVISRLMFIMCLTATQHGFTLFPFCFFLCLCLFVYLFGMFCFVFFPGMMI